MFTIYCSESVDGDDLQHVCDGSHHLRMSEPPYGTDICALLLRCEDLSLIHTQQGLMVMRRMGACDGSCRRFDVDIRDLVSRKNDCGYPVDIRPNGTTSEVLGSTAPLYGRLYKSSFVKRQGGGDSFCTGMLHVHIYGPDQGHPDPEHPEDGDVLSIWPCDRSCRSNVA